MLLQLIPYHRESSLGIKYGHLFKKNTELEAQYFSSSFDLRTHLLVQVYIFIYVDLILCKLLKFPVFHLFLLMNRMNAKLCYVQVL